MNTNSAHKQNLNNLDYILEKNIFFPMHYEALG